MTSTHVRDEKTLKNHFRIKNFHFTAHVILCGNIEQIFFYYGIDINDLFRAKLFL